MRIATAKADSFAPTLILLGVRLGIDRITPAYWEALKTALHLPQSIGIAG
jgi:cysteine protease ATG4